MKQAIKAHFRTFGFIFFQNPDKVWTPQDEYTCKFLSNSYKYMLTASEMEFVTFETYCDYVATALLHFSDMFEKNGSWEKPIKAIARETRLIVQIDNCVASKNYFGSLSFLAQNESRILNPEYEPDEDTSDFYYYTSLFMEYLSSDDATQLM